MITHKTFSEQIKSVSQLVEGQNIVRDQLAAFVNESVPTEDVIDICETAVPGSNLFTVTVWYRQADNLPDDRYELNKLPEAQSADVLSRTLHEKERRARVNTMVDEHMIRSDSS